MDISTSKIIATLAMVVSLSRYIFFIYRVVTRKTFYSKTFNISLAAIAIITAGIILAMQSNLVISLGMVGALSIVRFRTAIKDPMDLIFLFWAISIGIICGGGLYEVAVITSIIVTVCLLGLDLLPVARTPMYCKLSLPLITARDRGVLLVSTTSAPAMRRAISLSSVRRVRSYTVISPRAAKPSQLRSPGLRQ